MCMVVSSVIKSKSYFRQMLRNQILLSWPELLKDGNLMRMMSLHVYLVIAGAVEVGYNVNKS